MKSRIIDILIERAVKTPDQIAYIFIEPNKDINITYKNLLDRVSTVANNIKQACTKDDRVLLVYAPGLDYIIAFYACLLANVIAVPVYPPSSKELIDKLQLIIDDANPTLALSSQDIVNKIKQLRVLKKLSRLPLAARLINSFIQNKSANVNWDFDTLRWLPTDNLTLNPTLSTDHLITGSASDIAFLQYTSGSTGNPKGVIITHANIIHNLQLQKQGFELEDNDILANWLPPYHDMGLVGAIMQPMFLGVKGILMSPIQFIKKPVNWLKMISDHRATISGGPNFAYSLCVKKIKNEELNEIDLSSWRNAFCGAEPISSNVLEAFASRFSSLGMNKKAFFPCYGLAEATLFVSGSYYTDKHLETERVNCGRPLQTTVIVNPDNLLECSPGEIGEVWINGPCIAKGYWNKPELTKAAFQAKISERDDPFFRTGDLGFLLDNHLYPIGRIKDLIIINGKNYYPADIEETVLTACDEIRAGACVAFSIPGEITERLIIVAQLSRTLTTAEQHRVIVKLYNALISEWQIECFDIALVAAGGVEKTTSGKLQRFKVKQKYIDNKLDILSCLLQLEKERLLTSEENPTEKSTCENNKALENDQILMDKIKTLVANVLEANFRIDCSRPLVEYGLNSIKAIELSGLLEQEFKQKVEPTIFYNYPTVEQLSHYFSGQPIQEEDIPQLSETPWVNNDIAVIGISCRFPGGITNPDEFWNFLVEQQDGITSVPDERWKEADYSFGNHEEPGNNGIKSGGFLSNVDQFDEAFFNITPNEAKYIDPQQRLTLQEVWHAFENAGIDPRSLKKQNVGVFIGASNNDYARLALKQEISPYLGSGNSLSAIAGRVAYTFGFQGPCMTIDTACSSSLTAVHQAINALKQQDCTLAVAGGVNLILAPELSVALAKAQMLSPDGHCKAFSDNANGYVRSEGIGFVILKPLSEAIKDRHSILAVIKGSAINQDGASNGLTAPNGLSQETLLRRSLHNAGLNPEDIGYIESHGTGTQLGDPIEISAINAVFSTPNSLRDSLIIGALKSNLGHLESAAGIAGMIKTILILKHKIVPANLHCRLLNKQIDNTKVPLVFPNEALHLENKDKPYYAGVSSFGFTGTNVHVILSDHKTDRPEPSIKLPQSLLVISAQDQSALDLLISAYINQLKNPATDLQSLCVGSATMRHHFDHRVAVYSSTKEDMIIKLQECLNTESTTTSKTNNISFLFTGQGAQYIGMARGVYQYSEPFRKTIHQCDILVKKHMDFSIVEQLTTNNTVDVIERTRNAQPLLFCIEYALAKMWEYYGITPAYVTGHSLGMYAAACFSGVLDLEDAIALICIRANLMEKINGAMLALAAPLDTVNNVLFSHHFSKVDVAAINTQTQTVVSGELNEIDRLAKLASEKGIPTQKVSSQHAFHSRYMDSILDEFYAKASGLTYRAARIPLIEDITGKIVKSLDADYLTRQIRQPVNFIAVANTLAQCGCSLYFEIGPHPVLCSFIESISNEPKKTLVSLRKNQNDWLQICQTLQSLYLSNYSLNWKNIYASYEVNEARLPNYPFAPNRHWVDLLDSPTQPIEKKDDNNLIQLSEKTHSDNKEEVWFCLPLKERNQYLEQIITNEIHYVGGMDRSKSINIDENLFEMGIDSLMIVQLINNVNRILKQANISIGLEKISKPCVSAVIFAINQAIDEKNSTSKGSQHEQAIQKRSV